AIARSNLSARTAARWRSRWSPCWPRGWPGTCCGGRRRDGKPCKLPRTARNYIEMLDLSVVIPIRNEAPSLEELHRELTDTLGAWGRTYEIIIVDDGSSDESFPTLARLQGSDAHLRVIRFRRNFGQ